MSSSPSQGLMDPNHPALHPGLSTTDQILVSPDVFYRDIAPLGDALQAWHATGLSLEAGPIETRKLNEFYFHCQGINLASLRAECIRNDKVAFGLQSYKEDIVSELNSLWPHWSSDSRVAAQQTSQEFFAQCDSVANKHNFAKERMAQLISRIVTSCEARQQHVMNPLLKLCTRVEKAKIAEHYSLVIDIATGNTWGIRDWWIKDMAEKFFGEESYGRTEEYIYREGQSREHQFMARRLLDEILKEYNLATRLHLIQQLDDGIDKIFKVLTSSYQASSDQASQEQSQGSNTERPLQPAMPHGGSQAPFTPSQGSSQPAEVKPPKPATGKSMANGQEGPANTDGF